MKKRKRANSFELVVDKVLILQTKCPDQVQKQKDLLVRHQKRLDDSHVQDPGVQRSSHNLK